MFEFKTSLSKPFYDLIDIHRIDAVCDGFAAEVKQCAEGESCFGGSER